MEWLPIEVNILQDNITLSPSKIRDILIEYGFDRSVKAVARKRDKLKETTPKLTVTKGIVSTLVVPDCHVSPTQNLSRFTSLGRLANKYKPTYVVFMGDFGNFDSLSAWDAGKEQIHGKRYKDDIKACKNALALFLKELEYVPRIYFLGGNHDEGRVEKYIEAHAQLRGHMDIAEDLELEKLGITYIPYKKFLEIEGTLFCHAIMNAANVPCTGKNVMNVISSLVAKSVVVGHHHRFETASFARFGADDIQQVMLSGLFCEDTPEYAEGGSNSYWRGVSILTHFKPGRFDIHQISLDRLKAEY